MNGAENPDGNPPVRPLSLVVGVTGASGALYAREFLRALTAHTFGKSALITSEAALRIHRGESDGRARTTREYRQEVLVGEFSPSEDADRSEKKQIITCYDINDIGAPPASGSVPYHGMVIVPCSMKTLSSVARGGAANLLERAADVMLKERRKLILVVRETPYSLIHLRNMTALTEAGGIILPASPAFYQRPASLDDLGKFIAARILSCFDVPTDLLAPWAGDGETEG